MEEHRLEDFEQPPINLAPGEDTRSDGIVYVLENPAMPDYVKIGKTDSNLARRMQELFSTSVPVPFTCYYAARVNNHDQVEKSLFEIFGDKRAHPRREFFAVEPSRVATAIRMVQLEDVTHTAQEDVTNTSQFQRNDDKEDRESINRATARAERRGKFNFQMLNIPINSELQAVKDPAIVCKVVSLNPARVEFNGEETSLSSAAQQVMNSQWGLQGSRYWKYGDETLQEIRERMENTESIDE